MSGRQLSTVELGTIKFEEASASRLWPCEFVWNGKEEIALRGDWMEGTVDLELGEDRTRQVMIALPEGKHTFQLVKGGMDVKDGRIDVKDLEGLISKLASSRFGGKALRNVAEEKGSASGAKQLKDGSVEFTYNDVSHAKNVWVKGNFSDEEVVLEKVDDLWVANMKLAPGNYTFRFRVDIGESTKAESGPRSKLGWHAGSSTQKYLATNLQQVDVAELPEAESEAAESASKPMDLVKKTTLAPVAEKTAPEALAVQATPPAPAAQTAPAAPAAQTVPPAAAPKAAAAKPATKPVEDVKAAVAASAEKTADKAATVIPAAPTAPITSSDTQATTKSDDKVEEQKRTVPVAAVGGAIVAGVLLLLLRGGGDEAESRDDEPRFSAPELGPRVEVVRAGEIGSEFFAEVEKDVGLLRLGRGL